MIVPKPELKSIVAGKVGATTSKVERTVGETCWVRDSPRNAPVLARVVDVWPVDDGFELLLERVADELASRRPAERPKLRLSRAQRRALFEGGFPHIGGDGTPPVEAGESVPLSALVVLKVHRVDVKAGRWKLMYELVDSRDRPRLLRRTPPAHREGEYTSLLDPAAQDAAEREAAEQSAYTSSQRGLVAEAGEAPPRVWLEVRSKTQREFDHQRRLARHAQKLRDKSKQKTRRKKAA